ncbi:hypothetical protein [Inediibacterium massiliense]|uniref:YkvI family membrane protein n=1 Tax=Inediibacterium massiliense TaxID=1658111 RepID=UPI0006B585DA|nr:hypothetical protein [Inediibacterium massiliense]
MRKNVLKVASIYIGTLIGAGFASGQEVVYFFTRNGMNGLYGVILTSILFSLFGSFVLLQVHKYKITSYHDFVISFFGKFVGKGIEWFLSLLLLSFYCVMLAGSGALFEEYFGYSKEIGILFMSMICFFTFIFSMNGLALVNSVIVPLMMIGIICIGIFTAKESNGFINIFYEGYEGGGNWITSSLLYVSYNMISAAVVLSAMYPLLSHKKVALGGGILGGALLGCMLLFLFLPTYLCYTQIKDAQIPMMAIASLVSTKAKSMYGILLWGAMLTTAIANGFVLIQTLEQKIRIKHIFVCILFCIITIPLSQFGFKRLVHTLYPFFGYMGFFILFIALSKKIGHKI